MEATFDGSNHEDAMTTRSASSAGRINFIGLLLAVVLLAFAAKECSGAYYGKLIGKLSEIHHGVSGEVFAVDGRTLFIKDFSYDGEGPAAYFYAGSTKSPSGSGFKVRDERGTTNVLKRYRKKDVTLTLPDGKTLGNIKWFSVWCDEFSVNFGDVKITRGFDYPKPQKLGSLNGVHGVSSEPIVVVDAQTLLISGFSYDGEAPDAKFWVGFGPSPSPQGIRVPDENGKEQPLRRYDRKTIVLTLPGDLTVHQLGHFGVWCEAFTVDFGHIQIPQGLNVPPSLKMLGVSPQNVHRGGQGQTLAQLNLYEHSATGSSSSSSSANSSPPARPSSFAGSLLLQQQHRPTTYRPILRQDDQVEVVQAVDYRIPKSLQLQEPLVQQLQQSQHASYTSPIGRSLRYGDDADVSGVDRSRYISGLHSEDDSLHERPLSTQARSQTINKSKLNCEVLVDSLAFEVRWAVAGDSIVVQLVGRLEDGQYMSFGVSAYQERSLMIGSDVVVAWVDKHTLQGYAVDYILDAQSQCSGGRGSCPDTKVQDNTNSVRLLNAAMVNGYSIVTYQRPLRASDELDRPILTNGTQAIVWAIGPLNERLEASFHTDYLKTDRLIEFGRPPAWNCPMPDQDQSQKDSSDSDSDSDSEEGESHNQEMTVTTRRPQRLPATPAPVSQADAWQIPPIECFEPDDGIFYAQMGPTGGKHGYPAITGHVGWGISWYINGLLIPVINVVRGRNYTFVTEGGHDPDTPALYHPFYITDDPVGGYQHKTPEEKAKVRIFAGVRRQRGTVIPTGTGRLCNWVPDKDQPPADEFTSFGAYQRTLTLICESGEPGIVTWTPDDDTPDTVYYQCFTHRYLGWKINVLDSCGTTGSAAASEKHEVYVLPDTKGAKGDLEGSESIAVSSKVTPSAEFLQQHLHHPDREAAGLRYPVGHLATNPGKLSTQPRMPLLTNANSNHFERLQSPPSSSSSSSSYEEAYGPRVPYAGLNHQRNQYKHHTSASSTYRDQTIAGAIRSGSYHGVKQGPTEVQGQQGHPSSNQQLSNLVPDGPRPLSHPAKYTYTAVATSGPILYSRPPQHYASNYHYTYHHPLHHHHHHHHQPEQRATQLMIIKRQPPPPPPSVLMRRPMLQSHPHAMPSSALSHAPRPIFIERKKAVFRLPSSTYRATPEKLSHANGNQIAKLMMKLDSSKARSKLEAKVSQVSDDLPENLLGMMKPARNTGFDPSSIVIEGGFKPIVRGVEGPFDVAQKRMLEGKSSQSVKTNPEYRSKDNFEPVFIPSPPMANAAKKLKKKMRNSKQPLDEIDDMEMAAADRVESYYLPPVATTRLEELPNPSSGVLVTFDGKKLKDSSLARSISGIEEHSRGGLSSAILSRTPQFGKFKGELPPPIPADIRPDTAPEHTKRRQPNIDLSLPEPQLKKNTKLVLVGRSKRSPHEGNITDHQHVQKNTSSIDFHQPETDHSQVSEIPNAGDTILSNIGYVLLTIVCYYII